MTSPTSCLGPDGAPARDARVRIDRWLWAARFFKTRALAKAAIEGGRVLVLPAQPDGLTAEAAGARGTKPKPSRDIGSGDRLLIRRAETVQIVVVRGVDERRGSATVAARLFEETPESIEARETARAERQLARAGLQAPAARPDKRDRRERLKLKLGGDAAAEAGEPADDTEFDQEQP